MGRGHSRRALSTEGPRRCPLSTRGFRFGRIGCDPSVASFADGKIEAFLGPAELKAPDNLEAVIVEFLRGARKSLDIAVQELDSEPIAQAILDARWRGIDVDLFLEQDYLRSDLRGPKGKPPDPPTPRPGETPEQALFRAQWLEDRTELAENRRTSPPSFAQTSRCAALAASDAQPRAARRAVDPPLRFKGLDDLRRGIRAVTPLAPE